MATRVLVPLDIRSDVEALVPLAADLARGAGGTIRLLHVAPVPGHVTDEDGRVIAYADQEMQRLEDEARDYLQVIELHLDGIPVETVVRFGDPAREILAEAEASGVDVIAVATTCRSGLRRSLLGSVAEEVLRRARAMVVLVRPALT